MTCVYSPSTAPTRPTRIRKDDRMEVRVSREEKNVLAQAACVRHLDTGEFVRQAAVLAAEATLAEASVLRLNPEEWDAFHARLDEKPRDLPGLRALFSRPSVFAE